MSERRMRFRDVADLLGGRYLAKGEYEPSGGPYIVYGSNSVMGKHNQYLYEGPLIVLSRIGSYCGTVMWSPRPAWVNNNASAIRVRPGTDPRFVYYWLKTHDMSVHRRGSGQPFISHESLAEAPITLPPLDQQRGISEVLGALDDSIDVNRGVVRACDRLWLALASQALENTSVDADVLPLTAIARFVNGRAFTKEATGTGRMVIRIAELNSGPGGSTVYNDIDVPDQHVARPGDLLFAWSGSLTVERWFREEAIVNQHIFKVIPAAGIPAWLVHAHLLHLLDEFRSIASDKATTMGHIQRQHLEVPVPCVDPATLAGIDAQCGPLWQRALAAERETLRLADLRNALLPPLMSGKLRVRDAEALVVGEKV